MEFVLLAKVGMVVSGMVKAGYVLAGSYMLRVGIRYAKDYKYYSQRQESGAD